MECGQKNPKFFRDSWHMFPSVSKSLAWVTARIIQIKLISNSEAKKNKNKKNKTFKINSKQAKSSKLSLHHGKNT